MRSNSDQLPSTRPSSDRRDAVLASALGTFARFGYRKTSMEDVARAAHISRPGLYFLFSSKELLFRAAVVQTLERDIAQAEQVLASTRRPLRQRLLAAFDHWAGGYVGSTTGELMTVIEDNPDLLGPIVETAPKRFEELVTSALELELGPAQAVPVARTMISTSIGIKHQVDTREAYLTRLETAIDLLVP